MVTEAQLPTISQGGLPLVESAKGGNGMEWPPISVVVVNYNGRHHLDPCFSSLKQLDYPTGQLEMILVDNGSSDGSVAYVEKEFPEATIVKNPKNYGFAKGNNLGAQKAQGRYVAFLNNDTRVDPAWLRELVTPLLKDSQIVCTAAKILSWDEKAVDFVGSKINFYGFGFHVDYGVPYTPGAYEEERYIPAPCGAAMLIDRQVFLDAGGFDEDYFAFFEDLDLGWRLWVLGYKVLFAPKAVLYHRHHGTAQVLSEHRLRVIFERNAIFTLFKNYEQQSLDKVLPIALLLSAKRGLHDTKIDPQEFHKGKVKEAATQVPKLGLSCLLAMDEVVAQLPRLMEKRRWIQERRRRSDAEIFCLFPQGIHTPVIYAPSFLAAQQILTENLELPAFLRKAKRVLVLTHDLIGANMAGPGMRYWELARVLSKEFAVTLASPGQPQVDSPAFNIQGYARDDPASIATLVGESDVVFAFGFVLHMFPLLQTLDKPLIVDIYDPFILEDLEVYSHLNLDKYAEVIETHVGALNSQLKAGDFFVCASERQRDYWLGMLSAVNRVNPATYSEDKTLQRLIDVVPFGLPSDSAQHTRQVLKGVWPGIRAEDKVILWGGGIWEWFDPLTLIRVMARIASLRDDVKLFFLGKQHFDKVTVPETPICDEALRLSEELGLLDKFVFFNDWTPYEERQNYLLEADIGISLHRDTVEARFAFRTRMLDYIWAGLPVVTTDGDTMSEVVERYELGRVVACQDEDGLVAVLLELVDTPHLRQSYKPRFEAVIPQFTWEKVAEPLIAWCHNPRRAPDKTLTMESPALPTTAPVAPTPWWQLPTKGWYFLRREGIKGLDREIRSYVQWKRAARKR